MNRLAVAVLGAGFMGRIHAQAYASFPDVELKAICDPREEAARAVAGPLGAATETDYRRLLARDDLDAVSICTPEHLHREPVELAARAGKHVLVEKPIATRLADAEAIIAAAERAGTVLLVGHCLRFDPRYVQARAAIAAGQLGEVRTIYTRRHASITAQDRLRGRCSLPTFLGVHDYDVMRWLLGSEVERVSAESSWGLLRSQGYDVEDATCALLRFTNGALGVADLNWILPRGSLASDWRADVVGSRGSLTISSLETGLRRSDEVRTVAVDTTFSPLVHGHLGGMFAFELRHFVDCIRGRTRPAITPQDALMALRIALAVERAAASGRSVQP